MRIRTITGVLIILALASAAADAADGKISGYMFGDYYVLASASGKSIGAVKGAKEKKNSGFAFRRIYFQYNRKLDDAFAIRLRFEAADAGFGKGDKMVPFVKHAYLKHSKGGRDIYLGLSGTPTWSVSEKMWGYRSIEKTILDLHKIGSSADLGLGFKAKLDDAGKAKVHVMLGNGPGQKPEKDDQKKLYFQLAAAPSKSLTLVGYADWEGQPESKDKITFAGFVGLKPGKFQGGIEGFVRINKKAASGKDVQLRGVSFFGSAKTSDRAKVFGRFDLFDPSNKAGDDREMLFIAGLDFTPLKDVHIMPNVWAQSYQASGVDADVVPRVTVYYKF